MVDPISKKDDMLPHEERGPGNEPVATIQEHAHDSDMNPYIGLEETSYSRFSEPKTFMERFLDLFK